MNKQISSALLLSAFVMASSSAVSAEPAITNDYLTNLTSPKISWSSQNGDFQMDLAGEKRYYTYTKPEDYTETNQSIPKDDYQKYLKHIVFKNMEGFILILDHTYVKEIQSDFINLRSETFRGGAIENEGTVINLRGDFIGNNGTESGAIGNKGGIIFRITGNFIGNYTDGAYGGAIGNFQGGIIGDITGNFIGNYTKSDNEMSSTYGGAINNDWQALIESISGNFIGNYAKSNNKSYPTYGGAVFNLSTEPLTFTTKGKQYFFSGNYTENPVRGKNYNALYTFAAQNAISNVIFDTIGGGAWIVNDSIEGGNRQGFDYDESDYTEQYKLAFTGDGVLNEDGLTDQYVAINNDVINAGAVTVEGTTLRFGAYQHEDKTALNWDGHGRFVASLNKDGTVNKDAPAVTTLSLENAAFDIANTYMDTVNLKGYTANNSYLHIDVDPDKMSADMLNINGNVEGQTKVVVYASSATDIRGKGSIAFAQSENDTTGKQDSFSIFRVYGSPYMYEVDYAQTEANKKQWGLTMGDAVNPDKDVKPNKPGLPDVPDIDIPDINIPDFKPMPNGKRKVAPEVVAMGALPAAAIEQSRNMVDNVFGQIVRVEANHNLWVNPTYYTSNYDAPFDIDADVWGIEAGGDLQHDLNNKLGLFVSYRKGSYDMNGDGKHYYSTIGSEIDIDSYLAGLYYRYDRNNWYAFATLYGGIQQADIKTDDGVKSDTDGVEFGASLEAGYDYNLTDTVYLTPSLGVFYTQVNYDDATDSVGKKAKYNDLKQIELEAGVKLTKAFRLDEGYASVYVKPSVVQTLVDGDEVNITGLGKTNTLDDETLGRIEFGGRYGFTDQLSAYGWANYTFGSDYDATTVGLGLNYAW